MNKVDDINNQISNLYKELKQIQKECSHPKSCLEKEAKSNSGNYDPSADRYWYDFHCTLCDKRWSEDQEEYNKKERMRRSGLE
jgi:hypothetical protein